jgi:uracil-DNA glycosylase
VALVRIPAVNRFADNSAEHVRSDFEERARAELRAADALAPGSDAVAWTGELLATIALVKGLPGPAEASGGDALSGADGDAALKALAALGWDVGAVFRTLSRPEPGSAEARRTDRLRLQIEAVDPALVIALDAEAADDVGGAFGIKPPAFGREIRHQGRRFVAVDGLEASLGEPSRKKRVWRQLQAAKPAGPIY